jgi:NADH-quinone oxidoreductase subunit G
VLRVLANMLDVPGFAFESSQDVLAYMHKNNGGVPEQVPASALSNAASLPSAITAASGSPAVAAMYQLDSIVRRAPSLQLTADARLFSSSAEKVLS